MKKMFVIFGLIVIMMFVVSCAPTGEASYKPKKISDLIPKAPSVPKPLGQEKILGATGWCNGKYLYNTSIGGYSTSIEDCSNGFGAIGSCKIELLGGKNIAKPKCSCPVGETVVACSPVYVGSNPTGKIEYRLRVCYMAEDYGTYLDFGTPVKECPSGKTCNLKKGVCI